MIDNSKCYICSFKMLTYSNIKNRQKNMHASIQNFHDMVLWNGTVVKVCKECFVSMTDGLKIYKEKNPSFKPPLPKKQDHIYFESPAEEKAYPIIKNFAEKYNWIFHYQMEVGSQYGGYANKKEYYESKGWDFEDWMSDDWEDSSWTSEKYRIDFVLEKNKIRVGIEIDGAQWHANETQKIYDKARDSYLENQGFKMIRIDAIVVFNQPVNFENILKDLEDMF